MANARILGIVAAALIGAAWVFYVAGNAAPSCVSFIFGLIGMATGISYFNSEFSVSPGAAAAVSIVGVILNFIGAIVAGFIRAA
ncbi:unnamed protein product [Rotaria magnacalcarata]|uniref:Uncharacterized protein n=1 Tax=Rotaria magnacalcarata TaxID=392030 RepID=A0A816YAM1_9BILA|nr:unnamed protein product [Rotaria magnacalcarata]CAF3801565.1 unnamed protein product [Rotaria magnacalcarata]